MAMYNKLLDILGLGSDYLASSNLLDRLYAVTDYLTSQASYDKDPIIKINSFEYEFARRGVSLWISGCYIDPLSIRLSTSLIANKIIELFDQDVPLKYFLFSTHDYVI